VVGVVLGVLAVWHQIKPSRELVAELVVTKARLPGSFLRDAKALPDNVEKALAKNKDLARLIPKDPLRQEVVEVVKDTVERQSFSLHGFDALRDTFMAVTIRNEGQRPLREVKLGLRYPLSQSMTVIGADGSVKGLESTGVIALGDLPPSAEIKVFAWGMAFLISTQRDVTLSHQDGVGEVRLLYPVSQFIWGNDGVFFSYMHTTYGLLAIILLALGLLGLSRYRSTRDKKANRETGKEKGVSLGSRS
jgi:hypothetical protein